MEKKKNNTHCRGYGRGAKNFPPRITLLKFAFCKITYTCGFKERSHKGGEEENTEGAATKVVDNRLNYTDCTTPNE